MSERQQKIMKKNMTQAATAGYMEGFRDGQSHVMAQAKAAVRQERNQIAISAVENFRRCLNKKPLKQRLRFIWLVLRKRA